MKKIIDKYSNYILMAIVCIYLVSAGSPAEAGTTDLMGLGGFGGLCLLGGFVKTGIDWKDFAKHRGDPEAVRAMAKNVTEFFEEPMLQNAKMIGQKFIPSDPNLAGNAPIVSVYSNTAENDFGYERLYDFVDMRQSTSKTFEILDVSNGITFVQTKEGEPAKVRDISTGTSEVGFLKYMGALGFLDDWWRFNQYYLIDEMVIDVRAKYYATMSQVHYELITNLTSIDQGFNTDDVTTINDAQAQILVDLKGKGYAIPENPIFKIACGAKLKARLAKAIAAAFTNPNTNNNQIAYVVDEVIGTTNLSDSYYWVILPGIKMKRAIWNDLNSESQRDSLRRAEDISWEGKFNAAIGDKKQVRRCLLA